MRSIAQATVWEYTRRAQYAFVTVWAGATSLPAITYGLSRIGLPVSYDDEIRIWLEFIFYVFSLITFNLAILSLQDLLPGVRVGSGPARLYALPIPTWRLVLGQLVCGMALMALLYLLTAMVVNAAFGVGWRLVGPAAIAAMSYAAIQAAVWSTLRLGVIQLAACALVGTALFFWVKTHFGPVPGSVEHTFSPVSAIEATGMLLVTLLSAGIAMVAVGRDRRGDMQGWIITRDCTRRTGTRAARPQIAFPSPARAQLWFEWREKGWTIPVCFLAMQAVIMTIQLLTGDAIADVLRSAPAISIASVLGAAFGAGMVMGHLNLPRGKVECMPFLATRPASDLAMASATLKTTALGMALAWGLWLFTALASSAALWIVDRAAAVERGRFIYQELPNILLVPLSILAASWILPAVLVPVGLAGRRWLLFTALTSPAALLLSLAFLHVLFSESLRESLGGSLATFLLVAMIAGPAIAFHVAGRVDKCLIALPWAALLWIALWGLALAASWFAGRPGGLNWQFTALLVGLSGVAISPLATAPLAIAWNRHR